MNDSIAPIVVDDVDDQCSCSSADESVYHSFYESLGRPQLPPHDFAPATPALPASNLSELDPLDMKDQRSYERATQHLKKPFDRSKAHRCVHCRYCRPWKWGGNAGRPKQTGYSEPVAAKREGETGLEESIEVPKHQSLTARPLGFPPVSLADFIKAPKKGSEKQFELVGRPRQVLALDDFTEIDSSKYDVDEWEDITAEFKQRKNKPISRLSYARVVANKA